MPYTINEIEDAVLARLTGLKASFGLRTLETYQEELTEESLKRLTATKQLPAIYVVYAGSSYTSQGPRKVEVVGLALFVAARSLRGDDASRRGGIDGPGCYELLAAARDLLAGQLLLDDLFPLELKQEEAVWLGNGCSLYGAHYETAQAHRYPVAG